MFHTKSINFLSSELQLDGTGPIYSQVKDLIVNHIESGKWRPGTKIPSENKLAKMLSISRMTAQRALRELTVNGYLNRVQGVGTFVANEKAKSALIEIVPISEEIASRGTIHSSQVYFLGKECENMEIASELGLRPTCEVFHSIIVHMANDKPMQIEDRYVNPYVAPNYLKQDFTKITPSYYLFQKGPLTKAEHIVEAVLPDTQTQKLLKIKSEEPCLVLNRKTWIFENVATKVKLIYPGKDFKLEGVFSPSPINHTTLLSAL